MSGATEKVIVFPPIGNQPEVGTALYSYGPVPPVALKVIVAKVPQVGVVANTKLATPLVGAVILIPIIIAYTFLSYWVFRDKVRIGDKGYH